MRLPTSSPYCPAIRGQAIFGAGRPLQAIISGGVLNSTGHRSSLKQVHLDPLGTDNHATVRTCPQTPIAAMLAVLKGFATGTTHRTKKPPMLDLPATALRTMLAHLLGPKFLATCRAGELGTSQVIGNPDQSKQRPKPQPPTKSFHHRQPIYPSHSRQNDPKPGEKEPCLILAIPFGLWSKCFPILTHAIIRVAWWSWSRSGCHFGVIRLSSLPPAASPGQ